MGFLLPSLRKLPSLLGRLWTWLESQRNLHSVPGYCHAIRLGRIPKDFNEKKQISAIQLGESKSFELSSEDKKSIPPHLSVWIDALTTPKQAYGFLPENSPCRLVIRLNVDAIRGITGYSADGTAHSGLLNIVWVHIQDDRPGARGHAGITGLDEKSAPNKLLRKDLRSKLAELASKDCYVIPV